MNTATTLGAYATGLALVFGAAVGVGNAVGPVGVAAAEDTHGGMTEAPEARDGHGAEHGGSDDSAPRPAAGLAVSQAGYTLLLDAAPPVAGQAAPLSFRVLGPDGAAVTDYTVEHDKELHLVVVRRDGTQFQHLHPTRTAGRWTTPLTLPLAGSYKVFADFTPAGAEQGLTLATDVAVPGPVEQVVLPAVQRTAVVDEYTVTVDGDLQAGRSSELTLTVRRAGRPVTDLQPYLGAYGHLVALRSGDLAYLHVHPDGADPDGATGGPEVTFTADVPSAGDYRLYLDFRHDGIVRTAELGLRAVAADTATNEDAHDEEHSG